MRIIYNNDGSIQSLQLGNFITKGNDGVDTIYVEIKDRATNTYTAIAYFTLPDGTTNSVPGVIDGNGYKITLTSSQTTYAGILKMSLRLLDLQDNILVTYNVDLTVNPSTAVLDSTNITQAEYETLVASLNSYVLKSENHPVLYRHKITFKNSFYEQYNILEFISGNSTPLTLNDLADKTIKIANGIFSWESYMTNQDFFFGLDSFKLETNNDGGYDIKITGFYHPYDPNDAPPCVFYQSTPIKLNISGDWYIEDLESDVVEEI